jgi:hypothetical protein
MLSASLAPSRRGAGLSSRAADVSSRHTRILLSHRAAPGLAQISHGGTCHTSEYSQATAHSGAPDRFQPRAT